MGYGGYSFEAHQALTRGREALPVQQVFRQRECHPLMSPRGLKVRESRDSASHPRSLSIVLALDVTGSMGEIPELLARKELPGFVKLLLENGVADPQVLFMAVGDAFSDKAPLQVGQFESTGDLMDQWLTWSWLEGAGGQGGHESYDLALYFAARHLDMDCHRARKHRGYLFITGDEKPYPVLSREVVRSVLGDEPARRAWPRARAHRRGRPGADAVGRDAEAGRRADAGARRGCSPRGGGRERTQAPGRMTGSRDATASIVVDLGFGDSGKGTIVDYLVRARGAGLVVRWNGGAQAGHTVVLEDGRHHVFAQLGAGTFVPGVRTHLAEPVVIHPTALLVEARRLAAIGVGDALDRLTIAESARVIAPLHQSANRLRELARGTARHGSCGVGVGEAVRDALAHPDDALRARDLTGDRGALRAKLARVRERLRASLGDELRALAAEPRAGGELAVVSDASIDERWIDACAPLREARLVVPDEALGGMLREGSIVLEGAQGVLLDELCGFHPHTTWSTCTLAPALELLAKHGWQGALERYGVLRTYLTRHGDGPFPTEDPALTPLLPEPHNPGHGFQGGFRVGALDLVLARYARGACSGVDALALTHLDRLPALPRWRAARAYRASADDELFERDADGRAVALRSGDLAHQERLARALSFAEPVYDDVPGEPEAFASWLESELETPIRLTSHGPCARDKRERGA